MPTCALCRKDRPLRRSHVISKFTHKRIKGFDGRILHFTPENTAEGFPFEDAFAEDLLCAECEARFQKWEEHAARMFNQKKVFDFPATAPGKWTELEGFNYPKMKLFLLSLLWRMGAARAIDFREVKLGAHLDRIAAMLLAGDPGSITDYGSMVTVIHVDNERIPLTRPGDSLRWERQNLRLYRAMIDGLLISWLVASKEQMDNFAAPDLLLQEDGTWRTHSEVWSKIGFLAHELSAMAACPDAK